MGGRSGTGSAESDALAVIAAAGRFGELEEDDDAAQEERTRIAEALDIHANTPIKPAGTYDFGAVVTGQATTATGQIKLTMTVPWEFRQEIWGILETMPFRALVRFQDVNPLDD